MLRATGANWKTSFPDTPLVRCVQKLEKVA
jgi:hypothetical protein